MTVAVTDRRKATISLPSDDQILIARDFDAPRHLVYRAYTTPELVRRWWCGQRGEVTVCDIDLRVGGAWRYEEGRTTLTILVQHASRELRDMQLQSGVEDGLNEALDRLEQIAAVG
jgi:uncharacterized protein YndB with AHSA1/START domain